VNTFRVIFNEYFGGSYEMLDDLSYMIESDTLYRFSDVTEIVRYK